jgi:hypothetical protein
MRTRVSTVLVFITLCATVWLSTNIGLAENSAAAFQKMLRERLAFDEENFAAVQQGQTVVKLLPVQDKREVAVSGLVDLQVPAELFLQSFRENMVRKSNPAILEIGRFSSHPTLDDLKDLTFENRDIEDLKKCVVGDCELKLSTAMIERLHREIDWQAPDYSAQASQLLKVMLLEYVRDYVARGDVALIEYNDQSKAVRVAEEQSDLKAASRHIYDVLSRTSPSLKASSKPNLAEIENAIVWSKVKFGLKPVIAFNHITIYKNEKENHSQILIASKQIYANHYFDSSLALTAFVNVTGGGPGSYLFYENRSRADGLEGVFSGIKRGIIEGRAVDGLKAILEQSKVNLTARALNRTESAPAANTGWRWKRLTAGGIKVFLLAFVILSFLSLLALSNWKGPVTRAAP